MRYKLERTPAQLFSKRLTHIRFIQGIAKDLDNHNVYQKEKKKRYLFETYIVYLVSNWQTFLAHLAEESFIRLIEIESSYMLSAMLRKNFYQIKKRFNTPKTEDIDLLFEAATGISKISSNWHWDNMSNENAKSMLDKILKIRHEIAHTGSTKKLVTLEGNFEYMEFLVKLANILNEVIDKHIEIERQKHNLT